MPGGRQYARKKDRTVSLDKGMRWNILASKLFDMYGIRCISCTTFIMIIESSRNIKMKNV